MIEGFEWTICLTKSNFLDFQSMLKYQILSNCLMHGWFLVMRLSFTGAVTPDTRIRPGRFEVPLQAFAMQRYGIGKVSKKVCTYKHD